jgi:hypothetical protein
LDLCRRCVVARLLDIDLEVLGKIGFAPLRRAENTPERGRKNDNDE